MNDSVNSNLDFSGVVSALYVYPIKSCAGVPVQEAVMTETGLEFDRAWMVVDEQGEFLTQRELPRMALVQPHFKYSELVLRAPGMLALHMKLNEVEAPVRVRVWQDDVAAFDMGPVAAQWFSDFLGVKARLVRFDPDHKRVSSRVWTGDFQALNQFSDGFPLLVVSDASLAQLNGKLLASGSAAVSMSRFRPNIVLGAAPAAGELIPHDEDRLSVLCIATDRGTVELKPVKPCARCPIPNIDPATGLTSPQVGDMLQSYRSDPRVEGAITFGMNAVVLAGFESTLKLSQAVSGSYRFD